jgi:hypothetical protein
MADVSENSGSKKHRFLTNQAHATSEMTQIETFDVVAIESNITFDRVVEAF